MNNLTNQQPIEFKDYYLNEYSLWNGEDFIIFNLVYVDVGRNTVTVAITETGKIVLSDYDLLADNNGDLYFEYGYPITQIYLKDFEEI